MFGGHGLYAQDLFVALIADERLYLKVDTETEARFAAAGCAPFIYTGQSKPVRMSYWTVPDEAMESPELMAPWGRLALHAAVRAASVRAVKAASVRAVKAATAGRARAGKAKATRAASTKVR